MSEGFSYKLQKWLQSAAPEAIEAREHLSEFIYLVNHEHNYHHCDEMEKACKENGEDFDVMDYTEEGYTVALAGLVFYEDTHGYGMFTEHWQTRTGGLKDEYFKASGRVSQNVTVLDTYGDAQRGLEECYKKEQKEYRKFNKSKRIGGEQ
jgi:hypothetical protein